jgi:glutamine synthetase
MALSCATAEDVLKTVKDQNVQMIDLRFTDLPGVWAAFFRPAKRGGCRCSQ